MADLEQLNANDHAGLRLGDPPGRRPHFVQIVAAEFATAAAACPIFLTKNAETGQFYAGAMFGFEPGENLLDATEGGARLFQPLDLERQGFFIGPEGEVLVDPGHPRFSTGRGAALFESDGQPSQSARRIQQALGRLQAGVRETDAFIQALLAHKLVEPIDIDLSFDDGRSLSLGGLYTVSLDSLGELDDTAVLEFFRSGRLQLAYAMAGSLKQLSRLAALRNDRLAA